jgi:hypothetical protein
MKKQLVVLILFVSTMFFLSGCVTKNENSLLFCEFDSDCVLQLDRCEVNSVNKNYFGGDYVGTPCRINFFQGPFNAVCVNNSCTKKVNCEKFCEQTKNQDELNWYYTLSQPNACVDYQNKFTEYDINLVTGICESLKTCACQ